MDQDGGDAQDRAEALDDDKLDAEFPPDEPLGVNERGVTAVEEDAPESFAERSAREASPQPDNQLGSAPRSGTKSAQLVLADSSFYSDSWSDLT